MAKRKTELVNKYEGAVAALKKAREESKKLAAKAIRDGMNDLFRKYPKLQTVGWPQYTPYFNDGDVCRFRAHTYSDSIRLNGYSPDYDDEYEDETLELTETEHGDIAEEVEAFLQVFDDEDLEAAFGEGMVTINRDGSFETVEYDHD